MVFENFSKRMQELIKERGFEEPTLAQKISAKDILGKTNVLLIAPTGFGKTESALLPLLDKTYINKEKPVSILYITPMRSLNRNLLDRLFWWCDKLDLEIGVRHGDTPKGERALQAQAPPHLLITTPETLNGILPGKKMREHLKNVKYVVIDEVHELVGSKRGVQLSVALERLARIAGDFQRIALSATVGEPEKVARFVGKDTKVLKAEGAKKYEIRVELPDGEFPKGNERQKSPAGGKSLGDISSSLFIGEQTAARLLRIKEHIDANRSVIVFTNTRETAEVLSSRLKLLDGGFPKGNNSPSRGVEVHHSSLSKESRIKSETDFKDEKLKALIATSSLELGIDIGSIDFIIQYLSPRQVSRLIQRVGRGGHGAAKTSRGVIITGDEDTFESSVIARKALNKELEGIKIHDGAEDVLATQIAGMTVDEYEINSDEVYETVRKAYPFRNLEKKRYEEILHFMGKLRLLWINPNENGTYLLRRSKKGLEYFYSNLSMIPDSKTYRIVSIIEGEPVGSLDEAFVAEHGDPGKSFICNGRAWRVVQTEGSRVLVEPIDDIESAIPAWEGEMIPVPQSVAQEVGSLRAAISHNGEIDYPVDEASMAEMRSIVRKHAKHHTLPDDRTMLVETYKDFVIIHSCNGTLINDTLGRYISAKISEETGTAVNLKTDPYRIILQTIAKPEKVTSCLTDAKDIEKTLETELERSSMFKYRFIHVAKRFGIISRDARFEKLGMSKLASQYYGSPAYDETMREIFLEKMDTNGAEDVAAKIKSGEIKIAVEKGLSALGEMGLEHHFSEVMKPRKPESEIFSAFRNRLMHTQIRLVCTNCADYSIRKAVKDIEERPHCSKCSSSLIAITGMHKREPLKAMKKAKAESRQADCRLKATIRPATSSSGMSKEDEKELKELRRSADLMVTYGKKYAMTQAGRGVGTETASRILAKLPSSEEQLLKYIFKAEKDFAKNKIYWK